MDHYYTLLGISPPASIAEIKKAYRLRAKQLHPDINNSEGATAEFILVNEAYEYLIQLKTGKINAQQQSERQYKQWQHNQRQQAQNYANMDYDVFVKSDYYRTSKAVNNISAILGFLILSALLVFDLITIDFDNDLSMTLTQIGMGLIIMLFMGLFVIEKNHSLKIFEFIPSIIYLFKHKVVQIVLLAAFSLFVFLRIGFNTLIPLSLLVLIYAIAFCVGVVGSHLVKKGGIRRFVIIGLIPVAVNVFFLLNFLISTNPVSETYKYDNQISTQGNETTSIVLERNKYDEYPGIRMFFDYNQMKNTDYITYTFADGYFGMRVLKTYEFKENRSK